MAFLDPTFAFEVFTTNFVLKALKIWPICIRNCVLLVQGELIFVYLFIYFYNFALKLLTLLFWPDLVKGIFFISLHKVYS